MTRQDRRRARRAVENALRTGVLRRTGCEVCGDPKTDAHHEDYSLPLHVRWLCIEHHWDAHRGHMVLPPQPTSPCKRSEPLLRDDYDRGLLSLGQAIKDGQDVTRWAWELLQLAIIVGVP